MHLIPKWPPRGKQLARVAQKRGHKGQFGWNKNKEVSQLTLQNNCLFSFAFKLRHGICKTVRKMTSFSFNTHQFSFRVAAILE